MMYRRCQSISALFKMANELALALTCQKKNALPLALSDKGVALFSALFSVLFSVPFSIKTEILENNFLNNIYSILIDLL